MLGRYLYVTHRNDDGLPTERFHEINTKRIKNDNNYHRPSLT